LIIESRKRFIVMFIHKYDKTTFVTTDT